jgi:catechol 2,3-dioxygenase-like lactoylglutathione lyase family enzyme
LRSRYLAGMAVRRLSHFGLCVRDLARAHDFYVRGLGFRETARLRTAGAETSQLLGLARVDLEAVYLERDGMRLELLHYRSPGSESGAGRRPMNLAGLTHLAFVVSDLDAVLASLAALGGTPLPESRVMNPEYGMRVMFLLDPDGTRLELVEGDFEPKSAGSHA